LTGIFGGLMAAAEGGQDRDGPLVAEGRLLSGHEIQQFRKGPGAAGGSFEGQRRLRQPIRGPGRPGSSDASAGGAQVTVDLAGDVTHGDRRPYLKMVTGRDGSHRRAAAGPVYYWCRSQTPKSWPPLLSPDGLATTVLTGVPSLVLMSVLACQGPMTVPCTPS
jgi:hypothetical protein